MILFPVNPDHVIPGVVVSNTEFSHCSKIEQVQLVLVYKSLIITIEP